MPAKVVEPLAEAAPLAVVRAVEEPSISISINISII